MDTASPFSAYAQTGLRPVSDAAGWRPVTSHMATEDRATSGLQAVIDPSNPLLWFGLFMLVTVGAAGVSGSARIGRAKVQASVGSS
jgi:hypothetical protein